MSLKNARVISTNVILGSLVGFINPFNKVMYSLLTKQDYLSVGHFNLENYMRTTSCDTIPTPYMLHPLFKPQNLYLQIENKNAQF